MLPLSSLLLVDTDPVSYFVAECLLTRAGVAQQVVALWGEPALASLRSAPGQRPGALLIALHSLGTHASDFLTAYHRDVPAADRVPVVVLATPVRLPEAQRLSAFGIRGVMAKPLTAASIQPLRALLG